jgi:hypothetical protein
MPITPFQRAVMQLLAAKRQPDSNVAGGSAINRSDKSPRNSADIDIFHDVADSVFAAARADAAVLANAGYTIEWLQQQPYLQRARVQRDAQELKLEWCYDSAFRFFPVQPDPEFGYCLHPADLAVNKALARAGRSEIRDLIDTLYLHETYLSLEAICWAACGKDQGFNPCSLLGYANAHMKFRDEDLAGENLARPVPLSEIKDAWRRAAAEADELFPRLPASEVGCLFLSVTKTPTAPNPDDPAFAALIRHFGSLRGAWPVIV